MTTNEEAVSRVLDAYAKALNASDTEAVLPLYAEGGVFMAPYGPSAIGKDALKAAYDSVFQAIRLTVQFHVAEIVEISSDWVFARTNSAGHTLNHATGATSAEANQELFLLHREADGLFKIARYAFSSTNPPN